jgi:hypothetical protein
MAKYSSKPYVMSELHRDAFVLSEALAHSVVLDVIDVGFEVNCIRLELGEGDTVEAACMIPLQDLASLGFQSTFDKWENIIINMLTDGED